MYFKFLVYLDDGNKYEYVPGYVSVQDAGVVGAVTENSFTYGWVKLNRVSIGDRENGTTQVNPISKAAWNFTRLNLPKIAYGGSDINTQNGFKQTIEAIASAFDQIYVLFRGFNKNLQDKGFGKTVEIAKSWIRLHNPDCKKAGGGLRVKKIEISDEWASMTSSQPSYAYGQVYDYTMIEDGKLISSGVASYEPMLGGDEIPHRMPIAFEDKNFLVADNEHYMEAPLGESFFPAPGVTYRKVTVSSLPHANVTQNATGKTEYEYYTTKDFPTITKTTNIKPINKRPNPVFQLLKVANKEFLTASQGYVIERNDMDGKTKSEKIYAEGKPDPISSIEYIYKTKQIDVPISIRPGKTLKKTVLDNEVDVILKSTGTSDIVAQRTVGVDYDIINDMREQETITQSGATQGNLDAFMAAIIPAAIPVVLPGYSKEKVRFRSVVTTKVIDRYALVDKVIATDQTSSVTTQNLAYDAETGDVLLTKVNNSFDDPVYKLNMPAHWYYDGMGEAASNVGVELKNMPTNYFPFAYKCFAIGDELLLQTGTTQIKGWVLKVNSTSIIVIDASGNNISGIYNKVKVIRSGKRNMQSQPIGTITVLNNPLKDNNSDGKNDLLDLNNLKVLQAGAIEYSDKWQAYSDLATISSVQKNINCCQLTQQGEDLLNALNTLAEHDNLLTSSYYIGNLIYNGDFEEYEEFEEIALLKIESWPALSF